MARYKRGSRIPGNGGTVILSNQGMIELLQSKEIRNELQERMMAVKAALPGSDMDTIIRPSRVVVTVKRGSDFDEANTGEMSRALDLAGGRRGTKIKNRKPARIKRAEITGGE